MAEGLDTVLVEFLRYNNWANGRLLEACEGLDGRQLALNCAGAYGTIHETLAHIVRSETWYIFLLTGQRPQPPFAWEDGPTVTQMRSFAEEVGAVLLQAARTVGPDAQVREEGEDGTVWHYRALTVYIQIINHGIEHRTNVTTVLNQEGMALPGVDGWAYLEGAWERLGMEKV